jgi:hypothetical protein
MVATWPKKTMTAVICASLQSGGLPQHRRGGAPVTRKWKAERGFWNPPAKSSVAAQSGTHYDG